MKTPGQPVARSITEARQESEERFRAIFAASPDYIYLVNTTGRILDANPALLNRVGLSLEQMRQMCFMDFFAGDNLAELLSAFTLLENGQEVKGLEVRARSTGGEVFNYEINAVPLKENGRVTTILSVARDITARKQVEEQFRSSHAQVRALAAHIQAVREEERSRIAREISADLGPVLTSAKMDLARLERQVSAPDITLPHTSLLEKLQSLSGLVETVTQSVYSIATNIQPPQNPLPKILIADHHVLVRRGVEDILAEEFGRMRPGEASSAAQVLALVRKQAWDLLMLGITPPDKSPLEVLKEVRHACPRLPVLVLGLHLEEQLAARALRAGATGYITEECTPEELVHAVKKVLGGETYVNAALAEQLAVASARHTDKLLHETLSDREDQVMRLLAAGKTVRAIAKELFVSVKTVHTYRARVLAKMNMRNHVELAQYAFRHQLMS
ncbi:MAG: PAS domain S-box protein [Candidatus Binatia bacterium]